MSRLKLMIGRVIYALKVLRAGLPTIESELKATRSLVQSLREDLEAHQRENDQLRRDSLRIAELADLVAESLSGGSKTQTTSQPDTPNS